MPGLWAEAVHALHGDSCRVESRNDRANNWNDEEETESEVRSSSVAASHRDPTIATQVQCNKDGASDDQENALGPSNSGCARSASAEKEWISDHTGS